MPQASAVQKNTLEAAHQAVEYAVRNVRATILDQVKKLDPYDTGTACFLVGSMLRAEFTVNDIVEATGMTRATIGRWAEGKPPKSQSYAQFVVVKLTPLLEKSLEEKSPSRPLPAGEKPVAKEAATARPR